MDTTLPFSLAAMNCDESINTDDVPTVGNISQTPTGVRGESIKPLLYQQRLPTMAERSHQTTKQANIIAVIKQPQPRPCPARRGRQENFSFFVFAILNVYGRQNNPSLDWQFCNFLCNSSLLTLNIS